VNQIRHSDDPVGAAVGGFLSGVVVGLQRTLMAFDYVGFSLEGIFSLTIKISKILGRSFGVMAGLGTAFAFTAYMYELNERSFKGPVGYMTNEERRNYNVNWFWKSPEAAPVNRAVAILEKGAAHE
jgi:hypothetical protein